MFIQYIVINKHAMNIYASIDSIQANANLSHSLVIGFFSKNSLSSNAFLSISDLINENTIVRIL